MRSDAEVALLQAAVDEARDDPRPSVPHEQVRAEILAQMARLRRKIEGRPQE
jgi:hypothetical protein